MASPITWQNVQGPDPTKAMLPMMVASQTMNNAFSNVKDTFSQYQTDTKDRNTNAFLEELTSRYRTPEEYQAAMASGEIDQLRASFGPMINSEQARNAPGEMLTQALSRAETFDKRADYNAQRAARPQLNAAHVKAALGNVSAYDGLGDLGIDVSDDVTAISSALSGYTSRRNAEDTNVRANANHAHDEAVNEITLNNLRREDAKGDNTRAANSFLAEQLHRLHQAVRPNAEGITELTVDEQSDIIERLINETAETYDLGVDEARALVALQDRAASAAGRSGYGEKALIASSNQALEDAAVDDELARHPLNNDPTDPVEKLNSLNEHIKSVAETKESWKIFGTSEHEKISREAAHYTSKPWVYTIKDGPDKGKTESRPVPLAALQYAAQQTFDSWTKGDVDTRNRSATSFHRYLADYMEREDTKASFQKLDQLRNKVLARKGRVGAAPSAPE